ncbi:hypothetical protein PENSPDRAFT_735878 [Peniophora sp. CONT]|nr:hypothetical protein PENSPDRAFT_735878 [Peniophora sp. CONT]
MPPESLEHIIVQNDATRCAPQANTVSVMMDALQLLMDKMTVADLQRFSQAASAYARVARRELRIRVARLLLVHIGIQRTRNGITNVLLYGAVDNFLAMLQRTRSVIAGATPLALLLSQSEVDEQWAQGRSLEVHTPKEGAAAVLTHLTVRERYTVITLSPDLALRWPAAYDAVRSAINGLKGVASTFTSPAPTGHVVPVASPQSIHGLGVESITYLYRALNDAVVIVVESTTRSALTPMIHSPTTLLVNYMTSTTLVCMYPLTTLKGTGILNPGCGHARDAALIKRYTDTEVFRIAEMDHDPVACKGMRSYCPRLMRSSEDSWSFTMDFEPRDTPGHPFPTVHVRVTSSFPIVWWVWGGWDDHAAHRHVPFVVPSAGIFQVN